MPNTIEWKTLPTQPYGVLCGTDAIQEWLLPWWWERYSAENAFPVTFLDFGMTHSAREWCAARGELVSLDFDLNSITLKESIDPHFVRLWGSCEEMWTARKSWFQKPYGLLHSPYQRGLWLDLDCEVLKSLDPLFVQDVPIALVREYRTEHLPKFHPGIVYNGGVVAFAHGTSIIEEWARLCMTHNAIFHGDDSVLSHLICEHRLEVVELPEVYNWRIARGINPQAVIWHWVGKKKFIKEFGGIKPALARFS